MNVKHFKELPLMGILRGIEEKMIEPLADTIIICGLKTVEITMNTPDAPKLISKMVKIAKGKLIIGAGTVLTMNDLTKALENGATFIVLPALIPEIVEYCVRNNIPVFPGALTPQEIYNVWELEPTMVKVFPAKFFGPKYIKEIKGPFNDIELLACGGVTPQNIGEFFRCGASAVAFGASVFKKEWLNEKGLPKIAEAIQALIRGFESA